ncbi:Hypothetical predicted protein [Mytilus galloprovincialis]|uniref:Uncharacterized protein n=1 Tax=Mytilus galloprovincialis TaxID=29158 RepID=A0A8B6DMY0_MYTGA|nr:Hypothetical predicted protein [Mytilus galloprovincialis]
MRVICVIEVPTTKMNYLLLIVVGIAVVKSSIFERETSLKTRLNVGEWDGFQTASAIHELASTDENEMKAMLNQIPTEDKAAYIQEMKKELNAIGGLFSKLRSVDWSKENAMCDKVMADERELLKEFYKLMSMLPHDEQLLASATCFAGLKSVNYDNPNELEVQREVFNKVDDCEEEFFKALRNRIDGSSLNLDDADQVLNLLREIAASLSAVGETVAFSWNVFSKIIGPQYTPGNLRGAVENAARNVPCRLFFIRETDWDNEDFGGQCEMQPGTLINPSSSSSPEGQGPVDTQSQISTKKRGKQITQKAFLAFDRKTTKGPHDKTKGAGLNQSLRNILRRLTNGESGSPL